MLKSFKNEVKKFQPQRFSEAGTRHVFISILQKLKREVASAKLGGKALSMAELEQKCPILHDFVSEKKVNIMVLEQNMPELTFKFRAGVAVGVTL